MSIAAVVSCGALLNIPLRFFDSDGPPDGLGVVGRKESSDRLCANVRDRRSVARRAAVTSAEGGSPKMKNLMNAPIKITTDS